ncbi:unnamed protein product [Adineta steineri]|uniref:Uncharacterized protein n=1 Tax=Adineta steineri TaxID=433720 RepID=A0A813MCT0_9BILA|nr:unnamed protein product [Adineta steineri]CAF0764222.1 unnamed protein product [Adineta steineri]CAF1486368.1 unnamed protein product [Adineta steineri]CAF3645056.1 unnamed protein product [Adineta steineri]CAF3684809.1 unnamed protein product [Adineta steineri]
MNKRDLRTFVDSYGGMGYWLMQLDRHRHRAYMEAARRAYVRFPKAQGPNTVTWLDIGTGPRMPLTRMVLENKVTEHVHAVEANSNTYRRAKALQESTPYLQNKVTLHEGYSSDINWNQCDPRPCAIIHDILGTVSSEEGCVQILHNTMKNIENVSLHIPHEFGTYCIPVSRPKVSWLSSICSILFGGPASVSLEKGVQKLYNPPMDILLCKSAQLVEKFESANIPSIKYLTKKITFIVDATHGKDWVGFYLAPYILTMPHLEDGKGIIDGLKQNTNWGVKYVTMMDDTKGIKVKPGDNITVSFHTDFTHECPLYRLEAWINDTHVPAIEF